jgi:hypothetical protein
MLPRKTIRWSKHSHRMVPITRSMYARCGGVPGAPSTSRMPRSFSSCGNSPPKIRSRSRGRYRGALSHGNASRCCGAVPSAVGWVFFLQDSPAIVSQYQELQHLEPYGRHDEEVD